MEVKLGDIVIYCAKRLPEAAALVCAVHPNGKCNLVVYKPNGQQFPAFDVGTEPATPVEHFYKVRG